MALQSHPLGVAPQLGEIGGDRKRCAPRLLPVADRPVEDAFLVPADEGVAKKGCHVVGDGPVDRILEIEDARVRLGDHEVARHEVAMHVHAWLSEVAREDRPEDMLERFLLPRRERDAQVAPDVPLGKEGELAAQERLVVLRQNARLARALPAHQRGSGVAEELAHVAVVQCRDVGRRAEVAHEEESLPEVVGEDPRGIEARRAQQLRDVDEGARILALGRRIHRDQGAPVEEHSEIAPEARVGRGPLDAKGLRRERAGEPRG